MIRTPIRMRPVRNASSTQTKFRTGTSLRLRLGTIAAAAVLTAGGAGVLAAPADASGCGFLGLGACTAPTAAPGTPVAQLTQINQSTDGGTYGQLSSLPMTTKVGTPNAGVVPWVGSAAARADDGAFVAYETVVDYRTVDLMVYSPALGGPAPVRLMAPSDYLANPSTTYPSIYLIHGGNDKTDYQAWSMNTNLPQETVNVQALFVMPSLGASGYATNFWNYGIPNGGKQYDKFVSTEIPQLLARGYRANGKMAVAGISSGATGALDLAYLHPGQYASAASFSGVLDYSSSLVQAVVQGGLLAEYQTPFAMWGSAVLNSNLWKANDPSVNVNKLKGIPLFVSAGNGHPGPLDVGITTDDNSETIVGPTSNAFVAKAVAAGLNITSDLYGNGQHKWVYWMREFAKAWPMLAGSVGATGDLVVNPNPLLN